MKKIKKAFLNFFKFGVKGSCSASSLKSPDEYKVIMAGNIMVAQGYQCKRCKVIRAYDAPPCNCP